MIFIGLAALAVSFLCYLPVRERVGTDRAGNLRRNLARAVLFPSVVTAQGSFGLSPIAYRGFGHDR